jgi:hypothetical protein
MRRQLHLQADDEQEHHHAKFGDVKYRFRIGEKPSPNGPITSPAAR